MTYDLNIRGWMTEIELQIIQKMAESVPENEIIVEVGSLLGRTSYCLAASNPKVKVYCFDQWGGEAQFPHPHKVQGVPIEGDYNTLETFIENTKKLENIIPIRTSAPNFPEIGSPFFVFIDLLHYNPCDWDTISYWLPKIKKGGILCGHDFAPVFSDVVDNVNRLEDILGQKVTIYENTSLWNFNL